MRSSCPLAPLVLLAPVRAQPQVPVQALPLALGQVQARARVRARAQVQARAQVRVRAPVHARARGTAGPALRAPVLVRVRVKVLLLLRR